MITKPTTFILGSGASVFCGYPTGPQLLSEILKITSDSSSHYGIIRQFTGSSIPINNFRERLLRSPKESIDEFLENNTKFLELGKFLIAYILIQREDESKLIGSSDNNWYRYLFNLMSRDCKLDTLITNRVSFITFNYDRSLEIFLANSIYNTFNGCSPAIAKRIIESFEIVHLHGILNPLLINLYNEESKISEDISILHGLYSEDSYREYSHRVDKHIAGKASMNLKIIFENIEENFKDAIEILQNSQRIYFLGFGYHPSSLQRLKFKELNGKYISGTAFGMGEQEIARATKYFNNSSTIEKRLFNCSITEFLRRHAILD